MYILKCSTYTILLIMCLSTGCSTSEETPEKIPTPQFESVTLDDSIQIGYGLAIGDVDGDGKDDIILADKKAFVWYKNDTWERHVLVEDLTGRDNVAIAARDINNDGKVEIAVGAMWNPGETSDESISGSVHYLVRPDDPKAIWTPIQLPHEPTVHRMRWVKMGDNAYHLVVLPLHGRGNSNGEGAGVRALAYIPPSNLEDPWMIQPVDTSMHMTHNMDIIEPEEDLGAMIYIAGKEGVRIAMSSGQGWPEEGATAIPGLTNPAGEVRIGNLGEYNTFIATIEPMHGTDLVVYSAAQRHIIDGSFEQGHALATHDILGIGRDQIVAGWRNENAAGKVGLKLYIPTDNTGENWQPYLIDDNTIAVEDVRIADLDADGRPDIIAAGRATNNLKVYWNRTGDSVE